MLGKAKRSEKDKRVYLRSTPDDAIAVIAVFPQATKQQSPIFISTLEGYLLIALSKKRIQGRSTDRGKAWADSVVVTSSSQAFCDWQGCILGGSLHEIASRLFARAQGVSMEG